MVEAANLLIPAVESGLSEALDLIESDLDAWCDLSKSDLPEQPSAEGSLVGSPGQPQAWQQQQPALPRPAAAAAPSMTGYHLDGHTISSLNRGSGGELIPISHSTDVGGLGRGHAALRAQAAEEDACRPVPVTENSASLSFRDSCHSLTPKSTAVKTLPLSPSQCLNFWNKRDTCAGEPLADVHARVQPEVVVTTPLPRDKTPLHHKRAAFVTPDQKCSMDNTPHIPTPFKNAPERHGPLKPLPQTPHLEEDLKEVLLSEAGIKLTIEEEVRLEKQWRKAGMRQAPSRKSASPWLSTLWTRT